MNRDHDHEHGAPGERPDDRRQSDPQMHPQMQPQEQSNERQERPGDPAFDDLLTRLTEGSLHAYPAIQQQPSVSLIRWQVMKISGHDGRLSRRLIGCFDSEGRVSSTIAQFDLVALQATTTSGRCYALIGPPGEDANAQWVWSRFAAVRGKHWDVTRAVMRLRQRKLRALDRAKVEGGRDA
jgi:hypothetical protein